MSHALVIDLGRARAERYLGRARVGPQAQIDAEDIAVGRPLGERAHEPARQTHGRLLRLLPHALREACIVEEDDEIDVARIVELACAELAHGEHEEAAVALGRFGMFRREIARLSFRPQERAHRTRDTGLGEFRERGRHVGQRPGAPHIGKRHEHGRLVARLAHHAHQSVDVTCVRRLFDAGNKALERSLRRLRKKAGEHGRLAQDHAREECTVAEETCEQPMSALVRKKRSQRRIAFGRDRERGVSASCLLAIERERRFREPREKRRGLAHGMAAPGLSLNDTTGRPFRHIGRQAAKKKPAVKTAGREVGGIREPIRRPLPFSDASTGGSEPISRGGS